MHCARASRARPAVIASMALAIDQLPDDVATLKRLLVERDAEVAQRRAELEVQRAEALAARLLIEKLKLQIARLRRTSSVGAPSSTMPASCNWN